MASFWAEKRKTCHLKSPHLSPQSLRFVQVLSLNPEKRGEASLSWDRPAIIEAGNGYFLAIERKYTWAKQVSDYMKLNHSGLFGPILPFFFLVRLFGNPDSGRVHKSSLSWETKH